MTLSPINGAAKLSYPSTFFRQSPVEDNYNYIYNSFPTAMSPSICWLHYALQMNRLSPSPPAPPLPLSPHVCTTENDALASADRAMITSTQTCLWTGLTCLLHSGIQKTLPAQKETQTPLHTPNDQNSKSCRYIPWVCAIVYAMHIGSNVTCPSASTDSLLLRHHHNFKST